MTAHASTIEPLDAHAYDEPKAPLFYVKQYFLFVIRPQPAEMQWPT